MTGRGSGGAQAPSVQLAVVEGNYEIADPVAKTLGLELGLTARAAHQLLYHGDRGLRRRVVTAIRAFRKHDALDRLHRWYGPIRQEMADVRPEPLDSSVFFHSTRAAIAFAQRENVYRLHKSRELAKAWVLALDEMIGALLRLRASLVGHHQLTGEVPPTP